MCVLSSSRCRNCESSPVSRSSISPTPLRRSSGPQPLDYGRVQPDDLIRPWREALDDLVPGLNLFDAHTHTGSNDPDGLRQSVEELLDALDRAGVGGAAVFTMHEPDGYSAANDRVLAEAAASEGRLVPFCRLDPHDEPAREAERCLDAGARGIKLHPRAENFRLEEPDTEPIFAVAHERRVPVIVHAGRGIPALGRDALDLCERFPNARIILAHAAICDLSWIWRGSRARSARGLPRRRSAARYSRCSIASRATSRNAASSTRQPAVAAGSRAST